MAIHTVYFFREENMEPEEKSQRSEIMTTQEISKYLGVHEMTVYRWLKKGVLPGFKIGGRWRSKKDVLDAYLLDRMNNGKFLNKRS